MDFERPQRGRFPIEPHSAGISASGSLQGHRRSGPSPAPRPAPEATTRSEEALSAWVRFHVTRVTLSIVQSHKISSYNFHYGGGVVFVRHVLCVVVMVVYVVTVGQNWGWYATALMVAAYARAEGRLLAPFP